MCFLIIDFENIFRDVSNSNYNLFIIIIYKSTTINKIMTKRNIPIIGLEPIHHAVTDLKPVASTIPPYGY